LLKDVHYYHQGGREPALGAKIEKDAQHLVNMYDKLVANLAFKETGWKM
jgi:hypothetical protein